MVELEFGRKMDIKRQIRYEKFLKVRKTFGLKVVGI